TFTAASTVYHHASLDSLKWLNVRVQDVTTNPLGAITVSVNASMFSKANTMVFVSCDIELIVSALFEINPGNGTDRISNQETGLAAHLVAIAAVNGQYYAAILPITTAASSTPINLNMTAVSQSQLQTMVGALP